MEKVRIIQKIHSSSLLAFAARRLDFSKNTLNLLAYVCHKEVMAKNDKYHKSFMALKEKDDLEGHDLIY